MDHVVHLLDGSAISIQNTLGDDSSGNPPREEPKENAAPSNKVLVAHAVRIGSLLESEVSVQTSLGVLAFLQACAKPHL